jgi:hypothetical protein
MTQATAFKSKGRTFAKVAASTSDTMEKALSANFIGGLILRPTVAPAQRIKDVVNCCTPQVEG